MSFQEDVTSGDFRTTLTKLKRRVTRNELTANDTTDMLDSVHNMRTQIDMIKSVDHLDNLHSNPIGPNDLVSEPDNNEVKIHNPFALVYGNGRVVDQTLNSVAYDSISIGDSPAITYFVEPGSYHYEPAMNFNGTSDFINAGTGASLDLTQFSIACWFRTQKKTTAREYILVSKGGLGLDSAGSNLNYGLWIGDWTEDPTVDGRLSGGFETAAGVNRFVDSEYVVLDGQWHHGCVTYDGSAVRLYLDGDRHNTETTSDTPETNAQPLTIGRNSFDSSRFFEGMIDQVYVWNNDLTFTEVEELWRDGTVPQTGNIVYSNTFGGSGVSTTNKKCYYSVPDGANNWEWNIGFHPASVKDGNSIGLNTGSNTNQFIYYDDFGTDFDFTANNCSFGFWIYLTSLPSTRATNDFIMGRRIDANNSLRIEIDDADNKLFGEYRVGGVSSTRQYDTALTTNTWYYINGTCTFSGPTLSLKVNDNADTSSVKAIGSAPNNDKLYFGGFGNSSRHLFGYLAYPHWYKHSTVLTTAERTSLYNYNTRTNTTEPGVFGFMQFG